MKHGTGAWVNQGGDSYIGEWKEGNATGFGVYTEVNGAQYEGTF